MTPRCYRARIFSFVIALTSTAVLLAQPPAPARDAATVVHVLNRLGFGPTPAAVERVERLGVHEYIEEQLRPERIDDAVMAARLTAFPTLTKSSRDLAQDYFVPAMRERREQQRRAAPAGSFSAGADPDPQKRTPGQMELARMQRTVIGELSQQRILRAAYSERQLEEVMVDFWMNHFNVFAGKGQVRIYLTEYERDAVRPRVFGRFRDLLGATAASPAMLFYLDNWQSTAAPDAPTAADADRKRPAVRRRGPRDLDSVRRPGQLRRVPQAGATEEMMAFGNQPQPIRRRGLNENYARELMELHTLGVDGGYSQKDVQEVARAFTGWTIATPRLGGAFRFDPRLHDDGEKVVLGHRIKAGGGRKDGETVLDLLAHHPSTARFIAMKLARRFVADEPPPALVSRAADRFKATDGDIREVVRVIVSSPEFFASRRAKVKNPFEFVVTAVRATNLDLATALPLVQWLRELGMPLYGAQPPTGYPETGGAWVNSGALLNRMNFAVALTGGQMRALRAGSFSFQLPAASSQQTLSSSFAAPEAGSRKLEASTAEEVRRALFTTALANDVSESTSATVAKASSPAQAAALTLGSPEFQKR
jgi:uncharacterized protein (DUF1800 family)